jgi:membrane protease YdiL (CAAX protease family)
MAASAAPVPPGTATRRRRIARWRPPVAVAAVVLGLAGGQAIALGLLLFGGDEPNLLDGIGLVLADVFLISVIVFFARKGARLSAGTLGIRRTRFWPAVGWSCVFFVSTIVLMGLWTALVGAPGEEATSGGPATGPPPDIVVGLVIFGVAVAAPISEEIAFRGYLFAALTRWRGPWPAALITALLFGGAHVAVYPPEMLPALAVFGFFACLLFWFTGSLLPCVAVHAFNNALVMGNLAGWTWQIPLAIIGAVGVSVLLLLPFARERAPQAAVA